MGDEYWTGEYDRWRARFDLLLNLPCSEGLVRVCVSELARRWRWTPRRTRRLVESLVQEGLLIHYRRLAHGVIYALSDEVTGGPGADVGPPGADVGPPDAHIGPLEAEPETLPEPAEQETPPEPPTEEPVADPEQPEDDADGRVGEQRILGEIDAWGFRACRFEKHVPEPRARSSPTPPVSRLTPSERDAAAEVLTSKPQLFDDMLDVWMDFQEVRRRCLSSLGHPQKGCRLTKRRALKIVHVLASLGKDTVQEAVANLPYSHWHCGTGRHKKTGSKLVPEAVFPPQQVQILSEIPERIEVWELAEVKASRRQTNSEDDEMSNFWRSENVVVAGPVHASRL